MLHLRFFSALVLASTALPLLAEAGTVQTSSAIDQVTVYPNGATVSRLVTFDVTEGAHDLIIPDLPRGLNRSQVQITPIAGDVVLNGLSMKRVLAADKGLSAEERKRLRAEKDQLQDDLQVVLDGLQQAAKQQAYVDAWMKRTVQDKSTSVDGLTAAREGFALVGSLYSQTMKEKRELLKEQRRLQRAIKDVDRRLSFVPQSHREYVQAALNVQAAKAGKGAVRLTYTIRQAGWRPLYVARLTTSKGKAEAFELVRQAEIFQNSQENWTNVAVTLSTTRPGQRVTRPHLRGLLLDERPKPTPVAKQYRKKNSGGVLQPMMMSAAPRAEAANEVKPVFASARVQLGAYQGRYRLPGQVTLGSGRETQLVRIDSLTPKTTLRLEAAPMRDKKTYLMLNVKNDSQGAWLPGKVQLYLNKAYIGTGHLPQVAGGAAYRLGFGPDHQVEIKRLNLQRAKGESGVISTRGTVQQNYRYTITNHHDFPVQLMLLDRMPYAELEDISVSLLKSSLQPNGRDYQGKRGILMWDLNLAPAKARSFDFGYKYSWPSNIKLRQRER